MTQIIYLSTASKRWPIERQEAALAPVLLYTEVVMASDDCRARDVLCLTEAACSVHVASLDVLSKRLRDFRSFASKLFERGSELIVYDETPQRTFRTATEAVHAWQQAKRGQGAQATKEKFASQLRDACEQYREHWGDPRFDTDWILKQVGVTRNTMSKYMGQTRSQAIRANRVRLQAQATGQGPQETPHDK